MSGNHTDSLHELPLHLAARPVAKGLGRVWVGTAAFNGIAAAMLVGISSFVVVASGEVGGGDDQPIFVTTRVPQEVAAVEPSTTTTTEASAVEEKVRIVRVPGPAAPATPAVAREAAERPVTCDRFATQPEAQAVFDRDRTLHAGLDGDADGIACEHLPGRPADPVATSFIIPTKAQLLRPSTRLYGVHTPEAPYAMHEVQAFGADVGKAPNTVLFFSNFSRGFPAQAVENSWGAGALPVITFEPIVEGATDGQPLLSEIAAGEWDEYFTAWAEAVKADGRPIALRFAQEMNGNWYSWSDGRFGNAPGDFVRAWRHVHDLFAAVGADQVLWVWSVNRVDNLPDKTLDRVYPGDAYVDWVGVSGYYRDTTAPPSFDATFARTLAELEKVAPSKLVLLTEVGAGTTEANRVEWMRSLFAALLEHQEIIGFSWFNAFKSGGDWQVQFSQATVTAFATGVADSRYGELVRRQS
ncbi:MAG: glycosyl hydrolase [Acidimicrobiia bacterium]